LQITTIDPCLEKIPFLAIFFFAMLEYHPNLVHIERHNQSISQQTKTT